MRIFIFVMIAVFALQQAAFAQSPTAINYTAVNSAMDIQYENDSIVWFFTKRTGGACRKNLNSGDAVWYNGTNAPAAIACGGEMLIAANGVKWFAAGGKLIRYNDTTWQEAIIPGKYTVRSYQNNIKCLFESNSHKIWFSLDVKNDSSTIYTNSVASIDDSLTNLNYITHYILNYSVLIGVDSNDCPWVKASGGLSSQYLYRLETLQYQSLLIPLSNPSEYTISQAMVWGTDIWLCGTRTTPTNPAVTRTTVERLNESSYQVTYLDTLMTNIFNSMTLINFEHVSTNEFWLSFARSGNTSQIFKGKWGYLHYDTNTGWTLPIYEDSALVTITYLPPSLVLGTDTTVWYIDPSRSDSVLCYLSNHHWNYIALPSNFYTDNTKYLNGNYRKILINNNNYIAIQSFISTSFHVHHNNIIDYIKIPNNYLLGNEYIHDIIAGENDTLWIFTDNYNVLAYHIPTDTWTVVALPLSDPPIYMWDIGGKVDRDGSLWTVGYSGLHKKSGNQWIDYNLPSSISGSIVDFDFSVDNTIWASFDNNIIASYKNNQWTTYNVPLDSNDVYNIYIDKLDNVWCSGWSDAHWIYYNGASWTELNSPLLNIKWQGGKIVQDNQYNYYIYTHKGLYNIDANFNVQIDSLWLGYGGKELIFDNSGNKWFIGLLNYSSSGIWQYNENGISSAPLQPGALQHSRVFYDANQNKLWDAGELPVPKQAIHYQPNSAVAYTKSNGVARYPLVAGNYTVSLSLTTGWALSTDSALFHVVAPANDTLLFGTYPTQPLDSVSLSLNSGVTRCWGSVPYWVRLNNEGSTPGDYRVQLVKDSLAVWGQTWPPATGTSGDTLWWDNVSPGLFGSLTLVAMLDLSQAFSPFDTSYAAVQATAIRTNQTVAASDSLNELIVCAYDPNDKQVASSGQTSAQRALPDSTLTYTIRFQNTGNDTAFTVVVVDSLPASLNANSFELIGSSHDVQASVDENGVARFRFEHIMLPDSHVNVLGSQGFVKFKAKPVPGLPDPTVISNKAYIYFDYNAAVITDPAVITLTRTRVHTDLALAPALVAAPNPTTGSISFRCNAPLPDDLVILSLTGAEVMRIPATAWQSGRLQADLRPLADGLYVARCGQSHTLIEKAGGQ